MLVDTHCHIHESDYPLNSNEILKRANQAGVTTLICVGTTEQSSREAVEFAALYDGVFASVGVHPHEVKDGWAEIERLLSSSSLSTPGSSLLIPSKQISSRRADLPKDSLLSAELATAQTSSTSHEPSGKSAGRLNNVSSETSREEPASAQQASSSSYPTINKYLQPELEPTSGPDLEPGAKPFVNSGIGESERGREKASETSVILEQKIVAIGEIGLDYFYMHSPREVQIEAMEAQIELALRYNLPVIFHVREAFDDFWPIFDNFHGIRGELHSFTDTAANLEKGLQRGLYVGVNGISTFTKDETQKAMFAAIPLDRLLLETDAPFLTPTPFRGKVNEPAFVKDIAEHIARIRDASLVEIATITTANARALFALH